MTRRVIVNISYGERPGAFINALKASHDFTFSGTDTPAVLDDNGIPNTTLTGSGYGGQALMPDGAFAGNGVQWVLKWPSTRNIRFGILQAVTKSSSTFSFTSGGSNNSMTVGGAGGRAVFVFNNYTAPSVVSGITVFFPNGAFYSPGSGEICLCRLSDEAAYDAGEYFTPEFIALISGLSPVAIRTMGWTHSATNNNYHTRWAYRTKPETFSWSNILHPNGTWGGTISGTNTYTIGTAPDSPADWTDGEIIQGHLTNANTSTTPTLQIGARSAKTITQGWGGALSVGSLGANTNPVFVYDAILDKVRYCLNGLTPATPTEANLQLAHRVGCALWDSIPVTADDDYVANNIAVVTNYLSSNPGSIPAYYPEYSNEIWNGAFNQTALAAARGQALGWSISHGRDIYGWYGLRARQMMGIITSLWNVSTPLKRVLAFQAFGDPTDTNTYRLKGTDLSTALGFSGYNSFVGVNYNSAPNRPIDFCDVLSYATYYQGAAMKSAGYSAGTAAPLKAALQSMANDYSSGNIANAIATLDADVRNGTAGTLGLSLIRYSTVIYPGWDTVASGHSKKVAGYEGGLELVAPTTSQCTAMGVLVGGDAAAASTALTSLVEDYRHSQSFYKLVQDQFDQFFEKPTSESAVWFVVEGVSPWSLLTGGILSDRYESYDAIATISGSGGLDSGIEADHETRFIASVALAEGARQQAKAVARVAYGYDPANLLAYRLALIAADVAYVTAVNVARNATEASVGQLGLSGLIPTTWASLTDMQ